MQQQSTIADSYVLSKVPMVPNSVTTLQYGNIQPAPGVYGWSDSVVAVTFFGQISVTTGNTAATDALNAATISKPLFTSRADMSCVCNGGTSLITLGGKQRAQYQRQQLVQLNAYRHFDTPQSNAQVNGQQWSQINTTLVVPAIARNATGSIQYSLTIPFKASHFYPFIASGDRLSVTDSFNIQQYVNPLGSLYTFTGGIKTGALVQQLITGANDAVLKAALIVALTGSQGDGSTALTNLGNVFMTSLSVGINLYLRKYNTPIYREPVVSVYEEQPYLAQNSFPSNFIISPGTASQYQSIAICNSQSSDAVPDYLNLEIPKTALTNVNILKDGVNIVQSNETSDAITQMNMAGNFTGQIFPTLSQVFKQKYEAFDQPFLLMHQVTLSSNAYDTYMGIQKFVSNI